MNHIIKQLLIVIITFLTIMWFQKCDAKRNHKIRKTFYEKYKLPLLVSCIVGLLLQANIRKDKVISWDSTELYSDTPISLDMLDTIGPPSPNNILRNNNLNLLLENQINIPSSMKKSTITEQPKQSFGSRMSNSQNASLIEQQIYTDLPDF